MSNYSPAYSITIRLRYNDLPGGLGKITSAIGDAGGSIGAIDIVNSLDGAIVRDLTVQATNVEHGEQIVAKVRTLDGVEISNVSDRTFLMHLGGKIEVISRVPVKTRDDLSMAYTPGVARVCQAIAEDPDASFNLTIRRNMVAVVSDGSAVLGLGNIGPRAAMPVMEGKALLFKEFGNVDAFPICLETQDVEEIINTVKYLAPTFGGINLEDISSPRCVEIEERLKKEIEIPVFHDDQHGTAVVVLAALKNALRVVEKQMGSIRVLINGAGAAGVAIAKLLHSVGVTNMIVCDSKGAIGNDRVNDPNKLKAWIAANTNPDNKTGILSEVLDGVDLFVGVSVAGALKSEDAAKMADSAIVFALANPDPEILPEDIPENVKVMATGRSDFPNQINNVLCFPGLFRGLLDVRASDINEEIKIAAAEAISSVIAENEIHPDYIIPSVFDRRVSIIVAEQVAKVAIETGVARKGNASPQ